MLKKIAILLLLALIVIQFIHPPRNKAEGVQPNYIGNLYPVPDRVQAILTKACNDCHSNNTRYPWYSRIQPVDWWLDNHVRDGKKDLNLDEYTHRRLRYQYHKLEEMAGLIKKNEMPLPSYTWIHKDAKLTTEEKKLLIDWTIALRDTLRSRYPLDSLVRKKTR